MYIYNENTLTNKNLVLLMVLGDQTHILAQWDPMRKIWSHLSMVCGLSEYNADKCTIVANVFGKSWWI